jgi:branched-subunit amino acid aminotransferase/4-amino-4-deoxychorismate lyase
MTMINYNGRLIPEKEPFLTNANRAFRYGDGFFESLMAIDFVIPFFYEHWARIEKAIALLKMEKSGHFHPDFLQNEIIKLLHENNFGNARIRITFFRADGGLYAPGSNEMHYVIETVSIERASFALNADGLKMGIYKEYYKPSSFISSIKAINALYFVMAGIYCRENELDDCFILNEKGSVIEALSSNIFLVKNATVYTPALQQGCVDGVMRKIIVGLCKASGIELIETMVKQTDLFDADEVFLTNAVRGMNWVKQFGRKVYARKFIPEINKMLASEIENRVILKKAQL